MIPAGVVRGRNIKNATTRTKLMKIPSTAKRVFKGIIFDVYRWEQEMFDETTSTFEI